MAGNHAARYLRRTAFICLLLIFALAGIPSAASGALEFNIILHDIQVQPVPGQLAHRVEARVSVVDPTGAPIRDLQLNNFTVLEDSTNVPAAFEEGGKDAPIALVMVMDTSGSMAGVGIDKARASAGRFVERLESTNRVALVSFNDEVEVVSEFNGPGVAQSALGMLQVKPGGGTCLYDAIFQSLQLIGAQPPGRRALLVMTDGRDELPSGKPCSATVIDDVVRMATTTLPTPIYLVGVGKQLDENTLGRLAVLTGGAFFKADDFAQLEDRFTTLFDQLKNQYVLSYESRAAPGTHTLTVQIALGSAKDQDTRDFMMADLPPVVRITGADDGQALTGITTLTAEISGQKEAVAQLEWTVNGTVASKLKAPPFTVDLDPKKYPAGSLKVVARAIDDQDKELSAAQLTLKVAVPPEATVSGNNTADPGPTSMATTASVTAQPTETGPVNPPSTVPWGWLIGGGLLGAGMIAGVIWYTRGARSASSLPLPAPDLTIDGPTLSGQVGQAELVVVYSDDPALGDRHLPLKATCTTLGRSAGNDLIFALDQPVSRRHAMIELRAGQYFLTELLSGEGVQKPPTFGTYVNDTRLSGAPVPLFPGAEIRLGSRLRLRFFAPGLVAGEEAVAEDHTVDDLRDETLD